jgi:hypothetical protein
MMGIFSKKKIIYTACFGDYDGDYKSADKYFNEENNPFDGSSEHLSPRFMAKLYKVLNPFSYDIWIDSSVEILKEKEFRKLFSGDFCLFKHPFNKTVMDELKLCNEIGYVDERQMENIIKLYESAKIKVDEVPMYAGGILYRTKKARPVNELWWSLICQYSHRDQLTLPYVIHQFSDMDIKVLEYDIYNNDIFKIHEHKVDKI